MAKAKRGGTSYTSYYNRYKTGNLHDVNAKKRLERALKRNPGNADQINLAIKNIHRSRKTPVTPTWSAQMRRIAGLYKEFTGTFNRDILSKNEKVSTPALFTKGPYSTAKTTNPKDMFSMKARAHTAGVLVWN